MAEEGQTRENLPIGTAGVVFESMHFDLVAAIAHIESLYTNKEVAFHQLLKFVCHHLRDFDYEKKDFDEKVLLGTLQVNFANQVWQQVFGFNGPESPWKNMWDELSDDIIASHFAEVTEGKVLLQDALRADNSKGLVRILAKGHRNTEDYKVLIHILPGSSGYGVASASKREVERQLSAERALTRGLKAEAAVMETELSQLKAELKSLKAEIKSSKRSRYTSLTGLELMMDAEAAEDASWEDPVPKADQGTKKRKMAEMPNTEALFK